MKRSLVLFTLTLATIAGWGMDADELASLKKKTDVYLERVKTQPDWLLSRLAMYWTTHATDVFLNGETYDHVGGGRAPYPTVKFCGTRSNATSYDLPKLGDVIPYDDDEQGSVTMINKQTRMMEKTSPAKTGMQVNTLNRRILGIARDAARIYEQTADTAYAHMALGVLDTYLRGIYYRNVPQDMTFGHQNTLTGMATFEVIHEDAIVECAEIMKALGNYADSRKENRALYDAALKKWMENIIANGVPHNNWNLYQAEFILKGALVLGDDSSYADGRGRQYYLDYIVNRSSIRQWSMKRLAGYGFDSNNSIWYECPGYSMGVVTTFCDFADRMDAQSGVDLFKEIPQLISANKAALQYLMPNRMICGYGDTHPWYMSTKGIDAVLRYAVRHGDTSLQKEFEALREAVSPDASPSVVEKYVSKTFYAPKSSWLVQRTGMDIQHGLMVSLNGSLGNHQHANGISMELYGKGWVLGPDAGIGKSLYSGLDYAEYYSQFPAHNTVCVDGVSGYPVMMSQHGFTDAETGEGNGATYSQVSFVEPETQSDQLRTNGIVKTSATGGYYVDIFRSRRKSGTDKFHDYFYHNLGQTMSLTASDGSALNMQPTEELAFAGGHLYAYSYIYNKESAVTDKDVKATFTMNSNEGRNIYMTMWMRGDASREVFSALSPVNLEYERMNNEPYDIDRQPVLTFVARQRGEAWNHPFVAVFEPSDTNEPSEIDSVGFFVPAVDGKANKVSRPDSNSPSSYSCVGIIVRLKNGTTDYIFSSPTATKMSYGGITVKGKYAVVRDGKKLIEK